MNTSPTVFAIRARVLHAAAATATEPFHCEEITFGPLRGGAVDLLLIDARAMAPAVLAVALDRVAGWQGEGAIRWTVLIWPKPELAGVVRALRAGVQDVVPEGLAVARVVRRLAAGLPACQRRGFARRVLLLLQLGRGASTGGGRGPAADYAAHLADEQRAQFERELAEREASLVQREQELRATAARVQADLARATQACSFVELAAEMRAELSRREAELQLMAQQTMAAPGAEELAGKTAFRGEMQRLIETQQVSLDRRERALAARERWLRDYEQALTGGRLQGAVN